MLNWRWTPLSPEFTSAAGLQPTLEICIAYRCMASVIITSHTHGCWIHHTPHHTTRDWWDQTPTLFSLQTKFCRMLNSRKLYLEMRPPPSRACPLRNKSRFALLLCGTLNVCIILLFRSSSFGFWQSGLWVSAEMKESAEQFSQRRRIRFERRPSQIIRLFSPALLTVWVGTQYLTPPAVWTHTLCVCNLNSCVRVQFLSKCRRREYNRPKYQLLCQRDWAPVFGLQTKWTSSSRHPTVCLVKGRGKYGPPHGPPSGLPPLYFPFGYAFGSKATLHTITPAAAVQHRTNHYVTNSVSVKVLEGKCKWENIILFFFFVSSSSIGI